MALYCTFKLIDSPDQNLSPFMTVLEGTMSGGTTNGQMQITLQEMPNVFPDWDLWRWMAKGAHIRIWIASAISGLIVFRVFGGILLDYQEIVGSPDNPFDRTWVVQAQSYDGAGLDGTAVGQAGQSLPAFIIPAGTFLSQVQTAAIAFNAGAALEIDYTAGVQNLTGAHVYPALLVANSTFRQVLRTLTARALTVNNALKPRFRVDVLTTVSSEFGPPVLYVYDAATAQPATTAFYDADPPLGSWSTIGPVSSTTVGRPPNSDRVFGTNIGGWYAAATAPSAGLLPNLLNPAQTWDSVVTNLANPDTALAAELAAEAAINAVPYLQPRWDSYGRARPGDWTTLYNSRLHEGYAGGKAVVLTDVAVEWRQKAPPTPIDGVLVDNPVLFHYTGQTRAPELGDSPDSGPDLAQVLALTPSIAARNVQKAQEPDINQVTRVDANDNTRDWDANDGTNHPLRFSPGTIAAGATADWPVDDWATFERVLVSDPTVVLTLTVEYAGGTHSVANPAIYKPGATRGAAPILVSPGTPVALQEGDIFHITVDRACSLTFSERGALA